MRAGGRAAPREIIGVGNYSFFRLDDAALWQPCCVALVKNVGFKMEIRLYFAMNHLYVTIMRLRTLIHFLFLLEKLEYIIYLI